MKLGYYLCGVTSHGSEDEVNLFNELYDKFSHNELTTGEVIDKILEYNGIDKKDVDLYLSEYPEELNGKTFIEGKFILNVCTFGEGYDVYFEEDDWSKFY